MFSKIYVTCMDLLYMCTKAVAVPRWDKGGNWLVPHEI